MAVAVVQPTDLDVVVVGQPVAAVVGTPMAVVPCEPSRAPEHQNVHSRLQHVIVDGGSQRHLAHDAVPRIVMVTNSEAATRNPYNLVLHSYPRARYLASDTRQASCELVSSCRVVRSYGTAN